MDVIRPMSGIPQDLHVLSSELVSPDDRLQVPVGPVDEVVHDGQSKDMRRLVSPQNHMLVVAMEI